MLGWTEYVLREKAMNYEKNNDSNTGMELEEKQTKNEMNGSYREGIQELGCGNWKTNTQDRDGWINF